MEHILKVLDEKIRDMELTITCKNYEVENLKSENARLVEVIKEQEAVINSMEDVERLHR